MAADANAKAERSGSELTQVIVDKVAGKKFEDAEKIIDMRYGSAGVKAVMRTVEAAVQKSIKNTTTIRSGSLINDWRWRVRRAGGGFGNGLTTDVLNFGDVLIYTPVGPNRQYAALVNHLVAKRGGKKVQYSDTTSADASDIKLNFVPTITVRMSVGNGRSRPARTKGFMAKAVNSVRRSPTASGFWIKVQATRGFR